MSTLMAKKITLVKSYLERGAKWKWEDLALEMLVLCKIQGGDREAELCHFASLPLRGLYRMKIADWMSKVWSAKEIEHIIAMMEFEFKWTLENRPAPVKEDPVAVA